MGREKTLQSTKKVIITHSLAVEWYMSMLAHVIISLTKVEGRAVRTFVGELNWDGRSHGNLLSWSGAAAICVSHTFYLSERSDRTRFLTTYNSFS